VFSGGLALYDAEGVWIGELGVSGDSSCADDNIAWRTRHNLKQTRAGGCLPILVAESAGTSGYGDRSVQTQNNRTIDGEVGGAKCSTGRKASDQTVLHKGEELKFFTNLPAKAFVDCIVRPCK
jgi:hypothetical protein